jgi:hypothetical protein
MQISHNRISSNYRLFFFKAILIYFFTLVPALSNDLKIGSITEITGEVIAITEEGDERILDNLDEIFLKDEILIGESSSATLQFDDNTTIVMKELTSLNVSEFENSGAKKTFQAKVGRGKIIIESGAIAKNSNGEMLIDLSNMSLGIRGTRFNASIKPNGNSEVALAEDSFGNVGQIEISSEGQTSNLTSTDQVVEVSETNEVVQRDQSEEEKQELKSLNETLVKVSKIDENELTEQLQEKLEKGKLQDANNDGIVDEADIEVAKEIIKQEKKQKIDFIVDNSSDENTTFLSDVIDQSDEQNIGETIEKIIETKDTLVEGVVENLSDKDNEFITTSTSEGAGLIKEKIFETIVAKETDKSAEILSKVMAKSDEATVESVINNITEKNTNEQSKLSLKVMADFSEKNPEKLETLAQNNSDQIEKLTISAVEEAQSSQEDADLIAKVVAVASDELVNKMVEEVNKNSTDENQALSAKVMKSIVETNPDKIETLSDQNKEAMISQTIEAAKNQAEGTSTDEIDLSNTIAEIVTKSDTATAAEVLEILEEVSNESESKLSLNVVSNITKQENYEEKLEILSVTSPIVEQSINKLIEKAVENATSEEDLDLVTNIVENSKGTIGDKIINSANKNEESKKKITEIIIKVVEKNPEKAIEIIEKNQNTNTVLETVKTKIENGEAVSTDDFENVFDTNVSPN